MARDKPEWLSGVPPRLQTIENSMAETLERFESMFTSLPRSDDALQSGLSRGVPCWTSLLAISLLAEVLGRLQSVVASLASVTNSSDGERAAEDVEERLQAIEASLRGFKPTLDERRRSALERIKRTSMASFVREEPALPALLAGVPDHLQSLESSVASMSDVHRGPRDLEPSRRRDLLQERFEALEDSLSALAFGSDADEEHLRAIETSQTSAHSELRSRPAVRLRQGMLVVMFTPVSRPRFSTCPRRQPDQSG